MYGLSTMSGNFLNRITQFQTTLQPTQLALFTRPADIAYFTGFLSLVPEERESYFILTKSKALLLYSAFSPVTTITGITYHPHCTPLLLHQKILEESKAGVTEVLLDTNSMYVNEYQVLETIKQLKLSVLDRQNIWQLRMYKDADEQKRITTAALLSRDVYTFISKELTVGITEKQLAWKIESYIKERGGELAFPTIVAYGAHSSLPHHQPLDTPLAAETVVLFDFGAKIEQYCSDMSRTVWFGKKPSAEFSKVKKVVDGAYKTALDFLRKKISQSATTDYTAAQLDIVTRGAIEQAGLGKNFIHTTGHGVGLEIHEPPSLYKHTATVLAAGMALTVEPGVYLPKKFGYRHENTVLLTEDKVIELTA